MKRFFIVHNRGIIALVLIVATIFFGFSSKMYQVKQCNSTVSKYVTAEYSETTTYPVSSTDSKGNTTVSMETSTDYWSEPASEVFSITKYNEMPEYPPMPEHDVSMRHHYNFDNFKRHTDSKVEVYAEIPEESTVFIVGIGKAKKCLESLNSVIIVDTWYSITYDSEF